MALDNGPKRDVTPTKNTFDKKDKGESFNEAANPWNNPGKTGGSWEDSYSVCQDVEWDGIDFQRTYKEEGD